MIKFIIFIPKIFYIYPLLLFSSTNTFDCIPNFKVVESFSTFLYVMVFKMLHAILIMPLTSHAVSELHVRIILFRDTAHRTLVKIRLFPEGTHIFASSVYRFSPGFISYKNILSKEYEEIQYWYDYIKFHNQRHCLKAHR